MKKSNLFLCVAFVFCAFASFQSCKEKEPKSEPTETLNFFSSVAGKQAAFTPMINFGDSFLWDFGDGNTSNDRNPVHIYDEGGTYSVTLKVTGNGETKQITKSVALALSNLQMLAGDNTYPDGKKWKISSSHSKNDRLAYADDNFTSVQPIPEGALGAFLGMVEAYADEFLFKSDGSFQRVAKGGGAFSGLVFATLSKLEIKKGNSKTYGLSYVTYPSKENAAFTFKEGDFSIPTVSADGKTVTDRTYKNVIHFNVADGEFFGLLDFTRDYIILELSPEKMLVAMFLATSTGEHYSKPTHAAVFTFEAIK